MVGIAGIVWVSRDCGADSSYRRGRHNRRSMHTLHTQKKKKEKKGRHNRRSMHTRQYMQCRTQIYIYTNRSISISISMSMSMSMSICMYMYKYT